MRQSRRGQKAISPYVACHLKRANRERELDRERERDGERVRQRDGERVRERENERE